MEKLDASEKSQLGINSVKVEVDCFVVSLNHIECLVSIELDSVGEDLFERKSVEKGGSGVVKNPVLLGEHVVALDWDEELAEVLDGGGVDVEVKSTSLGLSHWSVERHNINRRSNSS